MGQRGKEIVEVNVGKLVLALNKAYASEWNAYYQYWLGAKLAKGPMKDAIKAEFEAHASEELGHANSLADRIIVLGGTPVVRPTLWDDLSPCKFDPPDDPFVVALLDQNITAERCAINTYKALSDQVFGKDMVTHAVLISILSDEVEHEEDLQNLREDLELMARRSR